MPTPTLRVSSRAGHERGPAPDTKRYSRESPVREYSCAATRHPAAEPLGRQLRFVAARTRKSVLPAHMGTYMRKRDNADMPYSRAKNPGVHRAVPQAGNELCGAMEIMVEYAC